MHSDWREIRVGRLRIRMDAESETLEEATLARDEIALMDKCLRGIATPEERAEYLVKLNGFTFDEKFGRKVPAGLKPCGCGGSKALPSP